jgi:hypothetical protein
MVKFGQSIGIFDKSGKIVNRKFMTNLMLPFTTFTIFYLNGFNHAWPDPIQISILLPYSTMGIHLVARFIYRFLYHTEVLIVKMDENILNTHKKEERIKDHSEIMRTNAKLISKSLTAIKSFYLVIYSVVFTSSIILSLQRWQFILFAPFRIPFIDPNTLFGYLIHSIQGIMAVYLGYVCFTLIEVMNVFYGFQIIGFSKIIELKIRKFGEELIEENVMLKIAVENKSKIDDSETKQLIEIIKKLRHYDNYIDSFLILGKVNVFTVILLNSCGICFFIIVFIKFSPILGSAALIGTISQVAIACAIGEMIKHRKMSILNTFHSFPWYYLSLKNQKMFLQIIHMCQHSMESKLTILGDVNVELFASVLNASYTYFMCMWNIL